MLVTLDPLLISLSVFKSSVMKKKSSTDEVAGLVAEEGNDANVSGGLKEDVIARRD